MGSSLACLTMGTSFASEKIGPGQAVLFRIIPVDGIRYSHSFNEFIARAQFNSIRDAVASIRDSALPVGVVPVGSAITTVPDRLLYGNVDLGRLTARSKAPLASILSSLTPIV